MKERSLIVTTELIPRILDGTKTQGRGVIKPQPTKPEGTAHDWEWKPAGMLCYDDYFRAHAINCCPYGQVGDRLYIKEAFCVVCNKTDNKDDACWKIEDGAEVDCNWAKWQSPLFMPRWASRITLEITGIRVEKLQEITEEDAIAEGMNKQELPYDICAYSQFQDLWNSLNAKWKRVYNPKLKIYEFWQFPWCEEDAKPIPKTTKHPERYHCVPNCWVWVIEFKKERSG